MEMKKNSCNLMFIVLMLALIFIFSAAPASASYTLNLTGNVSAFAETSSGIMSGGIQYTDWTLQLQSTGLPITVQQGNNVIATVTLNQSYTIPPPGSLTIFTFDLTGPTTPTGYTETSETTSFYNMGSLVASESASAGASGQLASAFFWPSNNGAITFNKITTDFTVATLDAQTTFTTAQMVYELQSPATVAPIPGAVWLLGSGLAGLIGLKRKYLG